MRDELADNSDWERFDNVGQSAWRGWDVGNARSRCAQGADVILMYCVKMRTLGHESDTTATREQELREFDRDVSVGLPFRVSWLPRSEICAFAGRGSALGVDESRPFHEEFQEPEL